MPVAGLVLPGVPAPAPGEVVVHLDLHPANILLAADGEPVVSDWAVARTAAPALDTAMTALTIAATAVAGVPEGAGDVTRLVIPASWLHAVLRSCLRAVAAPPTPALQQAADLLGLVGAHATDTLRTALDLVADLVADLAAPA